MNNNKKYRGERNYESMAHDGTIRRKVAVENIKTNF